MVAFEVGGTAKSRSEGRGEEGQGFKELRSGVRLLIKKKNYFPVDLESSLIVYSSL